MRRVLGLLKCAMRCYNPEYRAPAIPRGAWGMGGSGGAGGGSPRAFIGKSPARGRAVCLRAGDSLFYLGAPQFCGKKNPVVMFR